MSPPAAQERSSRSISFSRIFSFSLQLLLLLRHIFIEVLEAAVDHRRFIFQVRQHLFLRIFTRLPVLLSYYILWLPAKRSGHMMQQEVHSGILCILPIFSQSDSAELCFPSCISCFGDKTSASSLTLLHSYNFLIKCSPSCRHGNTASNLSLPWQWSDDF